MSTYNKKFSCIANLLIYFTRRGLARMCFCFTVIATLVSWTNIRCNRFFFNRIWFLCIKLDPKECFKSICLATINWRRWRGCDRLKKQNKKIKIKIQNPIIKVSTWKYRNSAIYIKLWAFTVDIGSQDTKGARANGGKNSAEDYIYTWILKFSRKVHTLTRARECGFRVPRSGWPIKLQ